MRSNAIDTQLEEEKMKVVKLAIEVLNLWREDEGKKTIIAKIIGDLTWELEAIFKAIHLISGQAQELVVLDVRLNSTVAEIGEQKKDLSCQETEVVQLWREHFGTYTQCRPSCLQVYNSSGSDNTKSVTAEENKLKD